MEPVILDMLARYNVRTGQERQNALKEIIQEVALLGLWRARFFEQAAFYGGTALRILHGLDRFSEDLDFSLLKPSPDFSLQPYLNAIKVELAAFGFTAEAERKQKRIDSAIESGFIKANTLEHLIRIRAQDRVNPEALLKVRLEVDTDPPPDFNTENAFLTLPIAFSVRAYSLPDLFAGKMHALLCRSWKHRVKGRDWYDFVWLVSRSTPLHLHHLEMRMRQSGHYSDVTPLTHARLIQLLKKRIDDLDITSAKQDVQRFIRDPATLEVWSTEFFTHLGRDRLVTE